LQRLGVAVPKETLNLFRFVVGGLTALAVMVRVQTHRGVIVGGTLVFLGTLFSGFWSTFAYFAAIAPVLCWYIDDWLRYGDQRVRWPTDPVGRLDTELDRRWPPVDRWQAHGEAPSTATPEDPAGPTEESRPPT
jgi:hypothetical protein